MGILPKSTLRGLRSSFPVEDEWCEAELPQQKEINRSFLNSLVGLSEHDAEQTVAEAGLQPVLIEYGGGYATGLMSDVIYLLKGEDRHTIEFVRCGNISQIVEDV